METLTVVSGIQFKDPPLAIPTTLKFIDRKKISKGVVGRTGNRVLV